MLTAMIFLTMQIAILMVEIVVILMPIQTIAFIVPVLKIQIALPTSLPWLEMDTVTMKPILLDAIMMVEIAVVPV